MNAQFLNNAAQHNQQKDFRHNVQQTRSVLKSSGAIFFMPSDGKTNSITDIKGFDLVETNVRNAKKQYIDYDLGNRQFRKRRFTATIKIDKLYDVNELFKDPTSAINEELRYATERVMDKVGVDAAVGEVMVGNLEDGLNAVSAAADGVLTVDGKSGLNYGVITQVTENFINNNLSIMDFMGSMITATGKEHTALMSDDKFINNDYINGSPVDAGHMTKAGMYRIGLFAGSKTGGIQVAKPILPEVTNKTVRLCPVLSPRSIAMSAQIAKWQTKESEDSVNSQEVTVDYWINAMRVEGKRIQIIETTI